MATRITITDSGQTQTLNGPVAPDTPDNSLQRITEVYFAKKKHNRQWDKSQFHEN